MDRVYASLCVSSIDQYTFSIGPMRTSSTQSHHRRMTEHIRRATLSHLVNRSTTGRPGHPPRAYPSPAPPSILRLFLQLAVSSVLLRHMYSSRPCVLQLLTPRGPLPITRPRPVVCRDSKLPPPPPMQ